MPHLFKKSSGPTNRHSGVTSVKKQEQSGEELNEPIKKHRNHLSGKRFKEACVDAAITIDKERNRFYYEKLQTHFGNSHETYKVINQLLDKEYG